MVLRIARVMASTSKVSKKRKSKATASEQIKNEAPVVGRDSSDLRGPVSLDLARRLLSSVGANVGTEIRTVDFS